MKQIIKRLLLAILFANTINMAIGQLKQPAPIDANFRIGTLDNGLSYFIRHNEEPEERASFYIIQNVGALLEEDQQNGLAHFLEHMAFNGTEHFKGKGIINFLEKNGVAFGRNINAYTSFSETVYNISDVPTKRQSLIDSCLLVLHDWSNFLLLTEEEINAERGVISEEWRTRRTAQFRMRNKWFPVVFEGSMWAKRDIIGDLNIIQNFKPETIRKFYHDWYRTDLQAIAIIGDVDVEAVEQSVKNLFSKIPAVDHPKVRPEFEIPAHSETKFVVATDKEATNSMVQVMIKHKGTKPEDKNMAYIREGIISRLFNSMSRDRISELLQKGNPPFINGGVSLGGFVRGYDAAYITATANPNKEDVGLKAIYTEAQRIVRHGFTEGELSRAKLNLLTQMESAYKQRDKISNDRYARAVKSYYLTGEPLTSMDFDWEFTQKALPTISIDDVNNFANRMFVDENRVIVITGPEEGADHLTKEQALAILQEVEASIIAPYEDKAGGSSLIEDRINPGKVISEKKLQEYDAIEWTLANKVKVIFRKADFEKDRVALRAFSKGGTSLLKPNELYSTMVINDFISSFGVGEFDAITLRKVLTGKQASVKTSLGELTEGFNGSSTPKDFETMMQLLHLKFNNPRFDKGAFYALKSRYVSYLSNMANNPKKIMGDSLSLILSDYHERTKLSSAGMFDQISFDNIQSIYNQRFVDADDFIFIIVGNIEEDVAKEMAEKYIGSLKSLPTKESWIDHKVRLPKGKTLKKIAVPLQTAKANINIIIRNEFEYSPQNYLKNSVLKGILNLRFIEEVREKEGGTYGVRVSSSSSQFPYHQHTLRMTFDTDTSKAEHLKSIIYREIEKIVNEGPLSEDLEKVVLNMKKEREQAKPHNGYWLNMIYNQYYQGVNFDAATNFEEILDNISEKDIKKFAKKLYKKADIVDVTFVPKSEN